MVGFVWQAMVAAMVLPYGTTPSTIFIRQIFGWPIEATIDNTS